MNASTFPRLLFSAALLAGIGSSAGRLCAGETLGEEPMVAEAEPDAPPEPVDPKALSLRGGWGVKRECS